MFRRQHRTGGFEEIGAYSRAVRAGDVIVVSGTAATGPGGAALFPGDVQAQTEEAFRRAIEAVEALGGSIEDVLRTRMYLAAGADWRSAVAAHRALFTGIEPANTTLFVAGFPPEGVLVEVEIDAVVAPRSDGGS